MRAAFVSARLERRKAGRDVGGGANCSQESTQGTKEQAQQDQKAASPQVGRDNEIGNPTPDHERQIAERDEIIAPGGADRLRSNTLRSSKSYIVGTS